MPSDINDKAPLPTSVGAEETQYAAPCGSVIYPPPVGDIAYLSEAELEASRCEAFADQPPGEDIWLFGYGSLIWNPGLPVEESANARVHGYHRGLYMWSRHNRGTPEQPGLVLAIDRGGSCPGVAFRIGHKDSLPHLIALWQREMSLGAYRPAWLACTLSDGRRVRALSFVIRRDCSAYAGVLPDDIVHYVLRYSQGHYGTTLEYVEKTVAALHAAGIPDRALNALLQRCR